ncbi:hypothetical protein C0Q70_07642 [Pomacea canaliculata]|uniref:60S ribosomal export protein NMD3 n=1 Tax=Pomacea canaliculata TaxID=400727 RepID=A0A2T7PFL7_POMCA|nr:hypothetical protein C0Q70_07642 [Pomacea canaliculata]
MCVACLRTKEDITEGIPKQGVLYFCQSCERYLQPPSTWIAAQLESRELLSVCLKKLKGLNRVQSGAVLQQIFVVEYVVQNNMCENCHRVEAKDFWRAVVQVRQKADHKKTFFYLEQLILKHRAHSNTVNIKPMADGLDFYFVKQDDGRKLVDFLSAVVPCKYATAKELVSHDVHNNTYNFKHTFSVDIVPVCKDNIVCLPSKLAQHLGSISRLCICYRVTHCIHLIDPATLQIAEMSSQMFWRMPFRPLVGPRNFTEFMVMNVERIEGKDKPHRVPSSAKHLLVDVWVARMSDLGSNDHQFHTRSHLGHLLHAGDTVLGYDFTCCNLNHPEFEQLPASRVPDVMLVKKVFDRTKRNRRRKWKLKHMADVIETESQENEYVEFLEDLEEDQDLRQGVNIYKDAGKLNAEEETDDEEVPFISLGEMLEDLHIVEDATGGEGDPMME